MSTLQQMYVRAVVRERIEHAREQTRSTRRR